MYPNVRIFHLVKKRNSRIIILFQYPTNQGQFPYPPQQGYPPNANIPPNSNIYPGIPQPGMYNPQQIYPPQGNAGINFYPPQPLGTFQSPPHQEFYSQQQIPQMMSVDSTMHTSVVNPWKVINYLLFFLSVH